MSDDSDIRQTGSGKARWVAIGFISAFFASIFTVIYTGLNVEGTSAEFDSGFRSVTLSVGETRTVGLEFESPSAYPEAILEVTLPEAVKLPGQTETGLNSTPVSVVAGENTFQIDITAGSPGSGYLVARVAAGEPVGIYRVFVTVTED